MRDAAARLMTLQHRIDTLDTRFDAINASLSTETQMHLGQTQFGDMCWVTKTTRVWDQSSGGREFTIEKGMKIESFNTERYLGNGKVLIQYKLHSGQEVIRWMNQREIVRVHRRPIRKRSVRSQ